MKKPLHIIIEGADGTGKSTIVQMISRHFNIPIIKMPVPQDKVRTEIIEELSEIYNKTLVQFHESDFICDRAILSSFVYSKLLNRTHDLSYTENILQILNPYVFVMTTFKNGEQNESYRDDDIYNKEEVKKVDFEYYNLSMEKGYPLISVIDKSLIEIRNEIIELIENDEKSK